MNDIRDHQAIEAAAAAWLARRDAAQQWSAADEREMRAWVDESFAHRVALLRLQAAWQRTERMPALAAQRPPSDLQQSADRPPVRDVRVPAVRNRRVYRRSAIMGWSLAASLAVAMGVFWLTSAYRPGTERFATDVGVREAVTLADGSRVTLNTHTRGRAVVNGQERRFWLDEGEAYFEVAHDPARPFVVLAGRDKVTVLGTKFTVRHDSGRTRVTVIEGRVRLDRADEAGGSVAPVVMTPNDSALTQGGGLLLIDKTPEQVQNELSWRDGVLAFDQLTLGEVAVEFNRYNRVQLDVRGSAAALRISGNFDAGNVEGFARLAHEGFGLEVRRDGDRIVLEDR